ncbi:MAG: putative porin [Planctomycetota bacterium]
MRTRVGRAWVLCLACVAACLAGAEAAEIAPGITLSGDLRIRSESLFRNEAFVVTDDVHHAHLRLRVSLGARLDDHWDLGFRLATGGGTTSTNQDMDALNLNRAELFVDRAFARFHTGDERAFELYVGRMPNPYAHSMILWDSDFDPDGLAEKFVWKGPSADLFLNAGQHVLAQESVTDRNYGPAVYGIQPGLRLKRDSGTLAVAAAYYRFIEADGVVLFGDVPDGSDYAIADLHASWKAETAAGRPWGLWVDGLINTEAPDHRTAWGLGVDLGSTKQKGSARVCFSYMSIDRNALWVNLGDADFSIGLRDEDMQGFVLGAAVGVGEKATLGATWYYKDPRDTDAHEDRLDIDLVLKF